MGGCTGEGRLPWKTRSGFLRLSRSPPKTCRSIPVKSLSQGQRSVLEHLGGITTCPPPLAWSSILASLPFIAAADASVTSVKKNGADSDMVC